MTGKACPICKGGAIVQSAAGVQMCPNCDGSGEDPGVERFFIYVFQTVPSLSALEVRQNQRVVINGDCPFRLKMLTRIKTGDFRIRLYDSVNQYFSSSGEGGTNDRVRDTCMFGDGQLPFLVAPPIEVPAGGYLGFDLEDVSNGTNLVHLAFLGAKVYPSPTS